MKLKKVLLCYENSNVKEEEHSKPEETSKEENKHEGRIIPLALHFPLASTADTMKQFLEEKGHTLTEKAIGCNAEENAFMSGKGHITPEMARWISYMVPELTIDFINAYDFQYMKYLKSL